MPSSRFARNSMPASLRTAISRSSAASGSTTAEASAPVSLLARQGFAARLPTTSG